MASTDRSSPRWVSLWVVALASFLVQLVLLRFFTFGQLVPLSLDTDPCNLWKYAYQFPPRGDFLVLNWFGLANLPPPLNPFSLGAAVLPPWLFFTLYVPVISTCALLAMAAFLRELEIPRPASLFGAVTYAWQGDILSFIFPGHYGYIASWPFFALAAWGALRGQRTGRWAYALISGASCGIMVGLEPDRGGIASLLIAALYLAPILKERASWRRQAGQLALCGGIALMISLAAFFALFQSFIVGVSMGGETDRAQTYKFDTQFSLGPTETTTYLVPGFFGWNSSNSTGPYWGQVGELSDWPTTHQGPRSLNLAISTGGTVGAVLALLGAAALVARFLFPGLALPPRQIFFGKVILVLGIVGLVLAWGYHTPLYRLLFDLPLMDKWRNPLKWLEWTNFALITLGAMGVQPLLGSLTNTGLRRPLRLFLEGLLALLVLGLVASYPLTLSLPTWLEDDSYSPEIARLIISNLHTTLLVAVLVLGLACLTLRVAAEPDRLRSLRIVNPWLDRIWQGVLDARRLPVTLALVLILINTAQLGWVANHFLSIHSLALLTQTSPLLEQLKSEGPIVRVSVDATDPVLNGLLQNQFNTPAISCLEISAASRVPDALNDVFRALNDDSARLWFLAGVKNAVFPRASFPGVEADPAIKANIDHVDGYMLQPTPTPDVPSHAFIQLKDYLQKATFVPSAEIMDPSAQLKRLKDPQWNPRATVLLTSASKLAWINWRLTPPSKYPAKPQVDLITYHAHRIELKVQAPAPGYLLINDAFDPDWQVRIDGHPAPLLRADYILRAIAVPPGPSDVTLDYVAHYHVAGCNLPVLATNTFCDLFMLATWLVAGWLLRPGTRGKSRDPSTGSG